MKIHEFIPKNAPLIKGAVGIKNLLNPPTPPLSRGQNYKTILALGAESAGSFSVFSSLSFRTKRSGERNPLKPNNPAYKGFLASLRNDKNKKLCGEIYLSDDFGDLLDDKNYKKFQKAVLTFLKKNKIKPDIILTDLHPLYKTTIWGAELAKKYKAEHVQVQHHLAHIFSAIGEKTMHNTLYKIPDTFYGIALDGTGYGLDGKIWGGEIFKISPLIKGARGINRIGHLENQTMIGGDLAVKGPARILISILNKFMSKDGIFKRVKKYYSKNQFELLYNQLQNNFNCQETSSAGRILDAVSILLGFSKNERNYKHEPIDLLEKNSTVPYNNLKPKIAKIYNKESRTCLPVGKVINYELCSTYLFEYLIKNINKDKKRLAATAQLYIAEGLYEIIKKNHNSKFMIHDSYLAGGLANNKIILAYFKSKNKKNNPVKPKFNRVPRGDAGISFGQIIYYLLKK
jgi:hydrogenase maturation protein HypF